MKRFLELPPSFQEKLHLEIEALAKEALTECTVKEQVPHLDHEPARPSPRWFLWLRGLLKRKFKRDLRKK